MSQNGIPLSEAVIPRVEKAMPADFPDEPFLGLDDVEAHTTRLLGSKPSASMKSAAKRFYPGDVLYSRLRPYLNKVWLADRSGLCSSEFIVLPANKDLDGAFLKYRLNAMDFVSFANSLNAGDRPRVDFDQIGSFRLPPFSISYQKRIVVKIEELFSELEAGEESLRVARRQLGVYRQSLLKQAFEGHLTAKWRTQNPAQLEWRECSLSSVVDFTSGFAFKSAEYAEAGVPVVRISDVSEDGVSLANTVKIAAQPEFEKFRLQKGDILIAMSGATTGKFGELKSEEKCYLNQRVGCFRTKDEHRFAQRFLHHLLHGLKRKIAKDAYGGAQPNISGKQINAYSVPCPSPEEQQEIVRLLDEQFEVIERNEREIDGALRKSEALRQAILQKAFTGRLVPQVATDEHASELLARIRTQRESTDSANQRRPPVAKSTAAPAPQTGDLFPDVISFKPLGKTDLQAGIVALAIDRFQQRDQFLGHTIAEKVVHLADYLADLQLDRHPIKDAAGPNDFKHARKVEARAGKKGWFTVTQDGPVYHHHVGRNLPALLAATKQTLGPKLQIVENLLEQLRGMDTKAVEILATVYAAWNNLLLLKEPLSDEAIVTEARENWHKRKLDIPRQRFLDAIGWLKKNGFVPHGSGRLVLHKT